MSEVVLVESRFQPGGLESWRAWCRELQRREPEVVATLRDEGVLSEACFLGRDGASLFYFMEAEDVARARRVGEASVHPIDVEHRARREASLMRIGPLEPLFHVARRVG